MLRNFLTGRAECRCGACADNQYVHSAACIMGGYYAQPSRAVAEEVQSPKVVHVHTTWEEDLEQPSLNTQIAAPTPG